MSHPLAMESLLEDCKMSSGITSPRFTVSHIHLDEIYTANLTLSEFMRNPGLVSWKEMAKSPRFLRVERSP